MIRSTEKAKTKLTWKDISRIADWVMFTISLVYFVVVFRRIRLGNCIQELKSTDRNTANLFMLVISLSFVSVKRKDIYTLELQTYR